MSFAVFIESERVWPTVDSSQECIYVLIDPRDNTVRYVGRSRYPKTRIMAHWSPQFERVYLMEKTAWIADLAAAGLAPRIEIVAIVEAKDAKDTEAYWIQRCSERGRIYNQSRNKDKAANLSSKSQLFSEPPGGEEAVAKVAAALVNGGLSVDANIAYACAKIAAAAAESSLFGTEHSCTRGYLAIAGKAYAWVLAKRAKHEAGKILQDILAVARNRIDVNT